MILLIDSYDSFSHNLRRLIEDNAGKQVVTIFNDTFAPSEYAHAFETIIQFFDYIVVGPGPGHPKNSSDVGIVGWLFRYFAQNPATCVPVLGVCLGFQSMCHEFGNEVSRLRSIKHGQIYDIEPVQSALFGETEQDLKPFPSVRYHSLHVDLEGLNDAIVPLATCAENTEESSEGQKQNRILMAGKHASLPLYGVQYHPESVCSSKGDLLVRNFDRIAQIYNTKARPDLQKRQQKAQLSRVVEETVNSRSVQESWLVPDGVFTCPGAPEVYVKQFWPKNAETLPIDVCDYFDQTGVDFTFLNSAADPGEWCIIGLPIRGHSEVLTHSIDDMKTVRVSKYTPGKNGGRHESRKNSEKQKQADGGDHNQEGNGGHNQDGNHDQNQNSNQKSNQDKNQNHLQSEYDSSESHTVSSMWHFLASRMAEKYVSRAALEAQIGTVHSRKFPFFGGYMGVFSYEEGRHLATVDMVSPCTDRSPDTKLVYVERFILYDRIAKAWFLVSIKPRDSAACDQIVGILSAAPDLRIDAASVPKSVRDLCRPEHQHTRHEFPSREIYNEQFAACQAHLNAGDSYELCLTTQSKIFLPSYLSPWEIYKVLAVHKNPSPYSSFMDFDDCVLISSSPERFLSWAETPENPGRNTGRKPGRKTAELRPIKGTVKNTPEVSLEEATRRLRTPKEMGENLMIVDLIRHDLSSFTESVSVDALMAVEEYKTVFQLVSVIRGNLREKGHKGIDVLSQSLPPGSMTGAPKKRSVELLQKIEAQQPTAMPGGRRGLYSGVAGYWSITDDADWSVTIRSIVSYKRDLENSENETVWRIGAGGAITVLSEQEAEWEEMHVKLSSTLQTFL